MSEIDTELPCGCFITENDIIENPALRIELCERHDHGWLYVNDHEEYSKHR